MKIDTKSSLSHTTWNCKYHIVFAPKYRRQVIYGKIKVDIGKIIRKLCEWKGVEIIEAEACPDHIHILVSIPPKISIASFMGYLKGKSSLMIFDQHANMKYRYGNREFWCRGYYVDTVGKNKKAIAEYIRNQLQEDLAYEQMSVKELVDPFTGEPVKKSKRESRLSGGLKKFAAGRRFRGLSAQPVTCPYRAEQATGFAGGYDYVRSFAG